MVKTAGQTANAAVGFSQLVGRGQCNADNMAGCVGLPQLAAGKDAQTSTGFWRTFTYTILGIAHWIVVHTTRSVLKEDQKMLTVIKIGNPRLYLCAAWTGANTNRFTSTIIDRQT